MTSHTDCAWAAGLIDGEGCISFGTTTPGVRIKVTNTNLAGLLRFQRVLGGHLNKSHRRVTSGKWKDAYHVEISGKVAVRTALLQVLPYLAIKEPQARLILRYIDWRTTRPHGGRSAPLTPEDRALIADYRAAMGRLNAKGPADAHD